MKKNIAIILALSLFCLMSYAQKISIIDTGKSDYKIYLDKEASSSEGYAAEELQKYIEKASKVKLEITSTLPENGKAFLIGNSSQAKTLCPDIDLAAFAPDEILLRSSGNSIVLAGCRPRGSIYAVYEFLETELGVRFWGLSAETVPEISKLEIDQLNYRYYPPFQMREAFSYVTNTFPETAVKLRNNGHYNLRISERMGGHYVYGIDFCHTFNKVLDPAIYLKSNPEYFTLLSGHRYPAQFCLSNKEMRAEFIKNLYEYMDKNPDQLLIALSQVDGVLERHSCRCENCKNMREEIGGSTDMLIDFINEVADAVKEKNPEVLIETLAYSYTAKAPKTRVPRDNVIIRLCISSRNPFKPLNDEENIALLENYLAWSKITKKLSLWLYRANFQATLLPNPNLFTYKPDLQYFAEKNNIFAMFVQDMHRGPADFYELRAYISSKLQWNPQLDEKALFNEFLQGFYGPAAAAVATYIDIRHKASQREYKERQPLDVAELFASRSILKNALQELPSDSAYYKRVKLLLFSVNVALASKREMSWDNKNPEDLIYKNAISAQGLFDELSNDAKFLGVSNSAEHAPWSDKLKEISGNLLMPVSKGTVPQIDRPLKEGDWIEWCSEEMKLAKGISRVDDPKATQGKAALVNSTDSGWVIRVALPKYSGFEVVPKEIWFAVKCEPGNAKDNDIAFTAGIHDSGRNIYHTRPNLIRFSVADTKGDEYKWFKLGVAELLSGNINVFINHKPDESGKKLYFDRIIAVDPK